MRWLLGLVAGAGLMGAVAGWQRRRTGQALAEIRAQLAAISAASTGQHIGPGKRGCAAGWRPQRPAGPLANRHRKPAPLRRRRLARAAHVPHHHRGAD